jgi:hypothetical protein
MPTLEHLREILYKICSFVPVTKYAVFVPDTEMSADFGQFWSYFTQIYNKCPGSANEHIGPNAKFRPRFTTIGKINQFRAQPTCISAQMRNLGHVSSLLAKLTSSGLSQRAYRPKCETQTKYPVFVPDTDMSADFGQFLTNFMQIYNKCKLRPKYGLFVAKPRQKYAVFVPDNDMSTDFGQFLTNFMQIYNKCKLRPKYGLFMAKFRQNIQFLSQILISRSISVNF